MKKRTILWQNILYYCLIPIALSGIVLFILKDYIYKALLIYLTMDHSDFATSSTYRYGFYLALFITWFYLIFQSIRSKRYHLLTGRSYPKDHRDFHKSYSELVAFFTTNDMYKMNIKSLPVEDWHNAEGVIFAKYKDPYGNYRLVKRASDANGNIIAFGLPGSGKSTTQAATTAERFNANLPNGGCGVFAISIKGDLLNFVCGKRPHIKIFTPDKEEGSCHYDPLYGVADLSWTDRKVFAENLSIIICPDEEGENSAFFVGGARDYLAGVILYLLHLHDTGAKAGKLKFPEITETILSSDVIDITMKIHNCENPIPGEYTNSYIGSNEKNVSGIWSHVCKNVRPLSSGALKVLLDGEGNCITPDDLNTCDIYIDVPQDKYDVYAPCMAIIISNFLQAFMRRDDVSSGKDITPILFLLDEAVQLNLDFTTILSKAMSTLRSKKVSLFLLMQSVAQLEGRYGKAHAQEILDLCSYVSVFNAQDPSSRDYFQKLVGKRKMLKRSNSVSSSKNRTSYSYGIRTEDEFIFESADFGDLSKVNPKTGKVTHQVLVYASGKYIVGETTPCYQ